MRLVWFVPKDCASCASCASGLNCCCVVETTTASYEPYYASS